MIRTSKKTVHLRLRQTERPDARAFLAEAAARRRRQAQVEISSGQRVAALARKLAVMPGEKEKAP